MRPSWKHLLILLAVCSWQAVAKPVQAQRPSVLSRAQAQLRERLTRQVQEEHQAALKLLAEDYDRFAEKYLDPEVFPEEMRKRSSEEIARLRGLLALYEKQQGSLQENSKQAVYSLELTAEQVEQFSPPKPTPEKPVQPVEVKGYGEKIQEVLKSAISDLEAGNIREFMRALYPTGELDQLRESGQEEAYVKRLSENRIALDLLISDLKQMAQSEPKRVTQEGIDYAVFAVETDAKSLSRRMSKYVVDPKFPPNHRACILELDNGHWRFHDGNREARELARQASEPQAGIHELIWNRTPAGWRISVIPLF